MPSFIRNRIDVVSSASIVDDAAEALAEDVVDRAAEIDHAVDRVHAHRRQPAARRLVAARAPGVGLQQQRVRKRHRRFDVQDRAELARADPLAQLRHLGMEAAVVAEAERDARAFCGVDRPPRASAFVSANGFSQKTCLPAAAAAITCARVQRMRRREHDGIDRPDRRAAPRSSRPARSSCASANAVYLRGSSCASRRRRSGDRRSSPAPTRRASSPTSRVRRWRH